MQVSANWAWTALTQGEKHGEDGKVLAEGLFTRGAGTLRGSNMWLLGLQLVILKCKTKKKSQAEWETKSISGRKAMLPVT